MKFGCKPDFGKEFQIQFFVEVIFNEMSCSDYGVKLSGVGIAGVFYSGYFFQIKSHIRV